MNRGAAEGIVRIGGSGAREHGAAHPARPRRAVRGTTAGDAAQIPARKPGAATGVGRGRKAGSRSEAPGAVSQGRGVVPDAVTLSAAPEDEAGATAWPQDERRGVERIAGHTTRLRQLRFAKVLAETCNVAAAAASAGRTLATVHRWRSVDAAFAAAWDEALAIGYDRLENALLVYAIGKVDAVAAGAAGASISNGDLQLAVGMLQRHRAADGGRRGQVLPVRMPTEAESDAALKRALDGLARRGAAS
ncbi:hypothetical protein [Sphingomonas sp.]|jgi:hypothetical protein|uniref:hypothetical protein n=1 Tax=Sphingomonas sp. TaxID=28214 RepID=UPI00261D6E06|nr:hypothetical protein [Sphingomonas sp.]MDF2604842.1 hypothetical protein [Sphingomonas sp.]